MDLGIGQGGEGIVRLGGYKELILEARILIGP